MIDPNSFMPLNFVKKEPLTGSIAGMRYRFVKNEDKLLVAIWPEPFCFEKTAENKKQYQEFSFDLAGRLEAIQWLNAQYEAQIEFWNSVNTMEF